MALVIGSDEEVRAVERAVLGLSSAADVHTLFDRHLQQQLGSRIEHIEFRSGRIDAVWGVALADGRAVVIKAHRPPVHQAALLATLDAQRLLAADGYPAPTPLAGPDVLDGHLLTVESLLPGQIPDGRGPGMRQLLAAGLAEHIELLRPHQQLRARIGPGPSWWQYQDGPWPVSHDPVVDLQQPVAGYEWLDQYAATTAQQILDNRDEHTAVIAHADWYGGNVHVQDGRLSGVFDWDLIAHDEAVIAGYASAGYAGATSTSGGMSTPDEAAAFLDDYGAARGRSLTTRERRAAAGGAAWVLAFDARFRVGLLPSSHANRHAIENLQRRGRQYLDLGK